RGTTRCGTRRARARSSPCGRSGTPATSVTAAFPASPPDARPRMPEGHTLHRLAGALDGAFGGTAPAVSSPQGRFADGAALLDGSAVDRAWAHGKLLFVDFADGRTLYVHLGLIGKWFVVPVTPPGTVPGVTGAVRLRLLSEQHVADLRGPMACEVLD